MNMEVLTSGKINAPLAIGAGATVFSAPFLISSQGLQGALGFILTSTVSTIAGSVVVTPQTAPGTGVVADAEWIDCPQSVYAGFSLGATNNVLRGQIADYVLDQVRLKIVSVGAAGSVEVAFFGTGPVL